MAVLGGAAHRGSARRRDLPGLVQRALTGIAHEKDSSSKNVCVSSATFRRRNEQQMWMERLHQSRQGHKQGRDLGRPFSRQSAEIKGGNLI
jgi:hypothetical protein